MSEALLSVALEARHIAAGGRMVPFAGYAMPVQYTGIKEEHFAVRNKAGLFDVSHMGEVEFKGPDALAAVDHLITNDIYKLVNGQAMYTAMCREDGGIIDDLIVYRLADDEVMICVNASNRAKDFEHMKSNTTGNVTVTDRSDEFAQLALQGPLAMSILKTVCSLDLDALKPFHAAYGDVSGVRCLVARTGYTGEDGVELYIPVAQAEVVFDGIVQAGTPQGMMLCGLGCRDTLRLEARMLLYGQDITEDTNPLEAGLAWVTKLDRPTDFIGKRALLRIQEEGVKRRLRGFVLQDRGVLRPGYAVFQTDHDADQMGQLTSGTYSPTLEKSIGLGYVDSACADADTLYVDIRGKRALAEITRKPFYKRPN